MADIFKHLEQQRRICILEEVDVLKQQYESVLGNPDDVNYTHVGDVRFWVSFGVFLAEFNLTSQIYSLGAQVFQCDYESAHMFNNPDVDLIPHKYNVKMRRICEKLEYLEETDLTEYFNQIKKWGEYYVCAQYERILLKKNVWEDYLYSGCCMLGLESTVKRGYFKNKELKLIYSRFFPLECDDDLEIEYVKRGLSHSKTEKTKGLDLHYRIMKGELVEFEDTDLDTWRLILYSFILNPINLEYSRKCFKKSLKYKEFKLLNYDFECRYGSGLDIHQAANLIRNKTEHPEPQKRRKLEHCLVVKHVNLKFEPELFKLFSKFGVIQNLRFQDEMCFINYSNAESVGLAMGDPPKLMGKTLVLEPSIHTIADPIISIEPREKRTLFVTNIKGSTDEDLRQVFQNIKQIRIIRKPNGESKGYAYIEMKTIQDALIAINEPKFIHDSKINVQLSNPTRVSVKIINLPYETTPLDLQFNQIKTKIVRGTAYLQYSTKEEAKINQERINECLIHGRRVRALINSHAE